MAIIPKALYKACDARLRDRWAAIGRAQERLRDAQQRAYSAAARPPDAGGGHGGGHGDGMERKAISVAEAEEQLRQALAWDDVFARLDRIYPLGTREAELAQYLYGNGLTMQQCAAYMGLQWKQVWDLKNNYVINCALLAVQAGLAKTEE